jgi:hypothetical protein
VGVQLRVASDLSCDVASTSRHLIIIILDVSGHGKPTLIVLIVETIGGSVSDSSHSRRSVFLSQRR